MAVSMFLLYNLLQNCHTWLYLCFFYTVYFKTVTYSYIYVSPIQSTSKLSHMAVSICFFYTVYFKPVTHSCIYVSSVQSASKLSHMAVSMFLLYSPLQNCHTWLYQCLNDSLFPNFQEYNQFHIYNNIPRPQWKSKVPYVLLIFIWF